jgi:hypothetical protein
MNKIFTTFLTVASFQMIAFGQAPVLSYQQSPDLGGEDFINQTTNGIADDMFAVGSSDAAGTAGGYDIFLSNLDPNDGSVNWAKQYGSAGSDYGTRLLNDGSGNILIVGRTTGFAPNGQNDFALIQVDAATGAVNWSKSVGTDTLDLPFAVKASNDGGYIIGGHTQPGQRSSMLLMKVQTNGTVDWARTIGSQFGNERMYDIKALGSGDGYLVVGYTGIYGSVLNEAMFAIVGDDGSLQAAFTYGGSSDDDARKFADGTGGFYMAGNTRSYGVGVQDLFLAKFTFSELTQLPELAWLKTYGGSQSEDFTDLFVNSNDGMIMMLGHTSSFGSNGEALLLALSDVDGEVQSAYTYGSSGDEWLNSVVASNQGLVLAGYSNSFGTGNDAYLVKLGENGSSGCNEQAVSISAVNQTSNVTVIGPPANSADFTSEVTTLDNDITATFTVNDMTVTANELCLIIGVRDNVELESMKVFPVPTNDVLNISLVESGEYLVNIYGIDGRLNISNSFSGIATQLNMNELKTGVYVLEVTGADGVWVSRIVKN